MVCIPWFKVDDGFWSHPKVLDLSSDAIALWVRAGSYCSQHLTDGVILPSAVAMLGYSEADAIALVDAGLWDGKGDGKRDGYRFHDWNLYQPLSAQTKEKRDEVSRSRAEAGRKGAAARWGKTDGTLPSGLPDPLLSDGNGKPMAPSRTRTRTSSSNEEEKTVPRKRGTRLEPSWTPQRSTVETMQHEAPGVDFEAEHRSFVDYWIAQPGQRGVKTDWDATWRNWMRRVVKDRRPARPSAAQRAALLVDEFKDRPGGLEAG